METMKESVGKVFGCSPAGHSALADSLRGVKGMEIAGEY